NSRNSRNSRKTYLRFASADAHSLPSADKRATRLHRRPYSFTETTAMARPEITGRKARDSDDIAPPHGAYSIREFARAHGISEDMFYRRKRAGWGRATMRVGSGTLIGVEAAAAWRREREKAAEAAASVPAA